MFSFCTIIPVFAPVASGLDRPPYATILAILASLSFANEFLRLLGLVSLTDFLLL